MMSIMNRLREQKNYGMRSSYSNIGERIGQNQINIKTLEEIQNDEIERMKIKNPDFVKFFEIFNNNPILQNLKVFNLKQKTQLTFDEGLF